MAADDSAVYADWCVEGSEGVADDSDCVADVGVEVVGAGED